MTLFEIVAFYVAIHILILMALSYYVVSKRNSQEVSLGDGNDEIMQRAIRVQGNFTEYVPMALLGLLALAWLQAPVWALHAVGGVLTLARIMHATGLAKSAGRTIGRFWGTFLTWLTLLFEAGFILYLVIL